MVRIYLNKPGKKKTFVDVNIWSLVKANFLSGLVLAAIIYGASIVIFFIIAAIVAIFGLYA